MSGEVVFSADAHTYHVDGKELPSVTRILADVGIVDYSMIPEDVRQFALERGKQLHEATRLVDEADLDWETLDYRLIPYVKAYCTYKIETGFIPTDIETPLADPAKGYAGTPDRIGLMRIKGKLVRCLLDIKTSVVPVWTRLQTAAYVDIAPKPAIPARFGLALRNDETYRLEGPWFDVADLLDWQAALRVWQYKRLNA